MKSYKILCKKGKGVGIMLPFHLFPTNCQIDILPYKVIFPRSWTFIQPRSLTGKTSNI